MNKGTTMAASDRYLETLLLYFEEEVMGETYFTELSKHFDEEGAADKLRLLAAVESRAASAVQPLLARHGLVPRGPAELAALGASHVVAHCDLTWQGFLTHMATRYPAYIDQFEALERMAPAEDLPALEVLTDHEHAAIEFAKRDLAGRPDSTAPLLAYIGSDGVE